MNRKRKSVLKGTYKEHKKRRERLNRKIQKGRFIVYARVTSLRVSKQRDRFHAAECV